MFFCRIFIGRTDAEAETPVLWPPDVKNWLIWKDPDAGKDWRQEEKGTTEDEMVGWHHRLNGDEFEQTLGVGDGQGGLACCGPWGCEESDTTEELNWTELNWTAEIPSPELALFVVKLSKAHLTSHSRISGSRWVITPSWLSGSWKSFLYSSSVYSCHFFLISSASVRSIPFLSFIVPNFAWNVPLVSLTFLKRSLVFPTLLISSISLHWSLRKAFLSLLAILWNSVFRWVCLLFSPLPLVSLLFSAIFKASSGNHFAFLHLFPWGPSWSPPLVQCHKPPSIVLQAPVYQI